MSAITPAVRKLIVSGGTAAAILAAVLFNLEGERLTAYQDGGGIWTGCGGITRYEGKPVHKGQTWTKAQCQAADAIEQKKALEWVDKNIHVPLTPVQKAGIASFCPWNIGPGNCFPSTFYRKINAGDTRGACQAIKLWIKDGGRDCRIRTNNCFGQVQRRDDESALVCWGLQ